MQAPSAKGEDHGEAARKTPRDDEVAEGILTMTIHNDWTFWQNAIAGAKPETTPGTPHQGYFRNRYYEPAGDGKKRVVRYEAVAIWFDPAEGWQCARSKFGSGAGMTVDQIDELFASCCRNPVSYEVYQEFSKTGKWPDEIHAALEVAVAQIDANMNARDDAAAQADDKPA
ncbi:MAG: hypothetical protein P4M15_12460, partial [Alphaproteobacteria bacterium]|nr:hypothetical protein [Alphaproteobacteria bacterium]